MTSRTLSPDDAALYREWLYAQRIVAASLEQVLDHQFNLTLMDFELMDQLDLHGEPMRSCDLGNSVALSRSGATRAVSRLEKLGLATKQPSPQDARSVLISLTDSGRDLLQQMRVALYPVASQLLPTAVTTEQRPVFRSALSNIAHATEEASPCQNARAEAEQAEAAQVK